jgi:C-terminal processing protease CtpA/Prc
VEKIGIEAGKEVSGKTAVAAVELWPEDLAYLKIEGLLKGSGLEILDHVRTLDSKAGIILDFRGAGGQDLDSVSHLAGIGRPSGEPLFVVTDNQDKPLSTNRVEAGVSLSAPLMVLVDDRTRLAAEALVALWHGRPGIMVIGSATSGEIRFREALALPDGQVITLATRKLNLLQGVPYEGHGIRPDVEVGRVVNAGNSMLSSTNSPARPLSVKSERDRDLMQRVDQDAALRRATDILLGLRVLSGYGQR